MSGKVSRRDLFKFAGLAGLAAVLPRSRKEQATAVPSAPFGHVAGRGRRADVYLDRRVFVGRVSESERFTPQLGLAVIHQGETVSPLAAFRRNGSAA